MEDAKSADGADVRVGAGIPASDTKTSTHVSSLASETNLAEGLESGSNVNVLTGLEGKLAFAFLVTILFSLIYRACNGQPALWAIPGSLVCLKLFVLIPTFGLLVFSQSNNRSEFWQRLSTGALIYGPWVGFLLFYEELALLVASVLIFLGVIFLDTWPRGSDISVKLLHVIGISWVGISVIGLLIHWELIPPSALLAGIIGYTASNLLSNIVTVRLVIGAIFGVGLLIASVWRAFQTPLPRIPQIPVPARLTPSSASGNLLSLLFFPFLFAVDTVVALGRVFGNVLWSVGATIVVYLSRVGASVGYYIHSLVLRKKLWAEVFRSVSLYSLVYVFCRALEAFLPPLQRYLTVTTTITGQDYPELMSDLGMIFVFSMAVSLGVLSHSLISIGGGHLFRQHEKLRPLLDRQAFASANIVVALLCSAIVVYCVVYLGIAQVEGFGTFGPMALCGVIMLGLASLTVIIFQLTQKRSA